MQGHALCRSVLAREPRQHPCRRANNAAALSAEQMPADNLFQVMRPTALQVCKGTLCVGASLLANPGSTPCRRANNAAALSAEQMPADNLFQVMRPTALQVCKGTLCVGASLLANPGSTESRGFSAASANQQFVARFPGWHCVTAAGGCGCSPPARRSPVRTAPASRRCRRTLSPALRIRQPGR